MKLLVTNDFGVIAVSTGDDEEIAAALNAIAEIRRTKKPRPMDVPTMKLPVPGTRA